MLSSLLYAIGIFIAMLALMDLLLSQRQKELVSSGSVLLWSYLDAISYTLYGMMRYPREHKIKIFFIAVLFLSYIFLDVSFADLDYDPPLLLRVFSYIFNLLLICVVLLVPDEHYKRACVIAMVPAIVGAVLIGVWASQRDDSFMRAFDLIAKGKGSDSYLSSIGVWLIIPATAIMSGLFLLVVLQAAVAIIMAFVQCCEFLVRRIAEYPKGPVLAISVLLGAIAALLKAF